MPRSSCTREKKLQTTTIKHKKQTNEKQKTKPNGTFVDILSYFTLSGHFSSFCSFVYLFLFLFLWVFLVFALFCLFQREKGRERETETD